MADLTQAEIENWITNKATGVFHYTKVMDGVIQKELHPQLRTIMGRLRAKGIAQPVTEKGDGWWRPADLSVEEVCWWNRDGSQDERIILPFGINKYCYIPRKTIIVWTGVYNAGKTAAMINIVNLNIEKWADNIFFYVSEGAEQMKEKFDILNPFMPKPPPFKMFHRTENFADIIRLNPNGLHILDYLRVDMEKSYAISNKIFEVFNALGPDGNAVIAMQKPKGDRKLAFGGGATAWEPTLYVAMDKTTISFEKIKVKKLLDYDPETVTIDFKLSNGVKFWDIVENYG